MASESNRYTVTFSEEELSFMIKYLESLGNLCKETMAFSIAIKMKNERLREQRDEVIIEELIIAPCPNCYPDKTTVYATFIHSEKDKNNCNVYCKKCNLCGRSALSKAKAIGLWNEMTEAIKNKIS